MQQKQITAAAVILREDVPGAPRLVAYYVESGSALAPDALHNALSEQLPDYMIPSAWVRLDALPAEWDGLADFERAAGVAQWKAGSRPPACARLRAGGLRRIRGPDHADGNRARKDFCRSTAPGAGQCQRRFAKTGSRLHSTLSNNRPGKSQRHQVERQAIAAASERRCAGRPGRPARTPAPTPATSGLPAVRRAGGDRTGEHGDRVDAGEGDTSATAGDPKLPSLRQFQRNRQVGTTARR